MKRIFALAILALLGYLAYTYGLPKLGELDVGVGDDPISRCVFLADKASDDFGANVGRLFVPGGDEGAWSGFVSAIEDRVRDARSQCQCTGDACRKASEAAAQLGDLISRLDGEFRGGGRMQQNTAQALDRIHGLLNQARSLAREGR